MVVLELQIGTRIRRKSLVNVQLNNQNYQPRRMHLSSCNRHNVIATDRNLSCDMNFFRLFCYFFSFLNREIPSIPNRALRTVFRCTYWEKMAANIQSDNLIYQPESVHLETCDQKPILAKCRNSACDCVFLAFFVVYLQL